MKNYSSANAVKYVFGKRSIYGDFDEVIIHPNDAERLQKVVDFLKKHQKKAL